jgi:hypothetical protein
LVRFTEALRIRVLKRTARIKKNQPPNSANKHGKESRNLILIKITNMSTNPNYYQILEINENATPEEIKKSYKKLALK